MVLESCLVFLFRIAAKNVTKKWLQEKRLMENFAEDVIAFIHIAAAERTEDMTPPNDFAARLEGLMESIRTEPNALKRFGLIQQQDALLANHADAILGLVRAAEDALLAINMGLGQAEAEYEDAVKQAIKARDDVTQALAKLNGEGK